MNASDQLTDLMTIRQLLLGRVIAGENRKLNSHLNDIAKRLEDRLKSGKPFTEYQGRQLQKAIADLAGLVQLQRPDLAKLASMEADFAQGALGKVGIDIALPPKKVLQSIADTSLVQGATFGQWFDKLQETMRFDIDRAIKTGVSLGETNDQIARRILGAGGEKGSEVMPRGRRDAMSITRTAVQTIANEARLATYLENADVIKAVQWVSTLDSRTTLICMARSGKTWTIPGFQPIGHEIPWNGGPPAHWACRSTTIPVTKSFEELGGEGPDLSPTTRSSMDGQVAADLTFDDFLKGKPKAFADEMLGVGRADLWRAGKITLSDLLDARGVPLTLAELAARYGTATRVAAAAVETAATQAALAGIEAVIDGIVDKSLTDDTISVVSRKDALKSLNAQLAADATDARYLVETGKTNVPGSTVFKGRHEKDIGKAALSTEFSDAAASGLLRVKAELDRLAKAFNIAPLRGYKTISGGQAVADMGDGILGLNAKYFNAYAQGFGVADATAAIAKIEARIAALQAERKALSEALDEIEKAMNALQYGSQEWLQLYDQYEATIAKSKSLWNKANKLLQERSVANRATQRAVSTWKPGDPVDQRPFTVDAYSSSGLEQMRDTLFHEFGHHVHQTYAQVTSRLKGWPPIEAELRQLWNTRYQRRPNFDAELQSTYAKTNEKEWFAENFALFFNGKRDRCDPEVAKLIERLLNEQLGK